MKFSKLSSLPCLLLTLMMETTIGSVAQAAAIASYAPTGDPYIDGISMGYKWGVSSLTYSFPTSSSYYASTYGSGEQNNMFLPLNATQMDHMRKVFQMNSSVHNLTFSEIAETSTQSAVLRHAESDSPNTAWGYYPGTAAEGGDTWYNNTKHWYDTPARGNYAGITMIHETGHNLGRKHPHAVSGSFAAMPLDRDSTEYTVMSYRSYINASTTGGYTNAFWSYPQSLMMYDIAAMQRNYGANYGTNAGDTVYQWNALTGEMIINGVGQGAPGANKIFLTIWDGGGRDTYNFSNYTTGVRVNLQPGQWSTASSAQLADLGNGYIAAGNIANAFLYNNNTASLIEDAVGGSGDDVLVGNIADNRFTGGPGNDYIDGDLGNNTAVYSGANADYMIRQNADGTFTVSDLRRGAPDGVDTLRNIQNLQFSDRFVGIATAMAINHAPSALNESYSLDMNTTLSVSAPGVLANDSDIDGNAIASILVAQPAHGSVVLNTNGSFTYTPATGYYGADSFTYVVNDGALNSNVAVVSLNVQQVVVNPPVVVDTIIPVIAITSPTDGITVRKGNVNVNLKATDNVGVRKIELYINGVVRNTYTYSAGYTSVTPYFSVSVRQQLNYGSNTVQTKAYDAAGNVGLSNIIHINK